MMNDPTFEVIWKKTINSSSGERVFVEATYHGDNTVPEEFEVQHELMRGDGAKRQKTFDGSSIHEAVAWARGFVKGLEAPDYYG